MGDDFSYLTDSDEEKAVQDLISQAMDHSVLEQIAAINCSSFSNSDTLPSHLEKRFRNLKSLPATTAASRFPLAKSKSFTPSSGHDSNSNERRPPFSTGKSSPDKHSDGNRDASESNLKPKCLNSDLSKRSDLKSKSGSALFKSPSNTSSLSSLESELEACNRRNREQHSDDSRDLKKSTKSRSSSKSGTKSRWNGSESGSLSPPRRSIGCLWWSPKKGKSANRKQGQENRSYSKSLSSKDWGSEYDVEFVKTFSMKQQNKIMKKAMKEEEKINKEAEKIVKWAKQASDRMMNVSGLSLHDDDHQLSD